jgi:hypothetical protein
VLLFVVGVVGTIPELVLLNHLEDWKQWIPVVLLGLGLPLAAWHWRRPGRSSVRSFRWLGVLYVASGVVGVWFHLRGNLEFQRELDPTLAGWPLWQEVLAHGAPALAPGTMVWFGLLAMLLTYAGSTAVSGVSAASEE